MTDIVRHSEDTLNRLLTTFPVVGITGARQVGKSTLLKTLRQQGYTYVSLDDPFEREQAFFDPTLFITSRSTPLIIDEIQHVPALLDVIKFICDESDTKRDQKALFVLSGSQHFKMMKAASQSLAGRIGLSVLPPYSIIELPNIANTPMIDVFRSACASGLFPASSHIPYPDSKYWFGSYLQTYLERDIRTLYGVQNLMVFQKFIRLLASQTGNILNYAYFSSELNISLNTIKNWVSLMQASHLLVLLPSYYHTFGRRVIQAPKLYFTDVGFACYLLGLQKLSPDHPMFPTLFENFCVSEIVKYFWIQGQEPPIYYFRTSNGLEIPILVETGENIYAVFHTAATSISSIFEKQLSRVDRLFEGEFKPTRIGLYLGDKKIKRQTQDYVPLLGFLDQIRRAGGSKKTIN